MRHSTLLRFASRVLLFFCLGAAFAGGEAVVHTLRPATASKLPVTAAGIPDFPLSTLSVAHVVQRAAPSVVEVDAIQGGSFTGAPTVPGFPFPFPFGNAGPSAPQESLGSGFVLTATGYIATNEHVINGAQKISVIVPGIKGPLIASLVGADWQADLAVIKVNPPHPLTPLTMNTRPVIVGEPVVAIGNPYGLDNTVTEGVISAVGRPLTIGNRPYTNLLQTSAAINPGNSGGPLLDMLGRVVGINTAVSSRGTGIGFAIPADRARRILETLIHRGTVSNAFLGVGTQDINPFTALEDGLSSTQGVEIAEVYTGTAAAQAGLAPGDIILAVDGRPVADVADLVSDLEAMKPGQTASFTVLAPGGSRTVTVRLGTEPRQFSSQSTDLYGATPL